MNFFDNLFELDISNYYGVTGLNTELYSLYVYNSFIRSKKNILVVTNSLYEANELYFRILNYTDNVLLFPMDDFITSEAIAISPEFKADRINVLNSLVSEKNYIVVSNLMGVLRYLPHVDTWRNSIFKLYKGLNFKRDELINKLYSLGYEKESVVSETGKFAVRGYVIDIFVIGYDNPIRIEFWGDDIEDIKFFDVNTQLTVEDVDNILVFPYTEFLLDNDSNSNVINKQKYLKNYSNSISGIWDYVGRDSLIYYYDYNLIKEGYKLLRESIFEYDLNNNENIKTDYMFNLNDVMINKEIFFLNFDNYLSYNNLDKIVKFDSCIINNYNDNIDLIKSDLKRYISSGKTVIICCDNESTLLRIKKYLDDVNLIRGNEFTLKKKCINIIIKSIGNGFIYDDYVVMSSNDFFKYNNKKRKYNSIFKLGSKVKNLNSISKGDYIVHEYYGIGIYDDLYTLTKNGLKKDYIKLVYAGGDSLYIPVEKIDRISKFSDKDGTGIKLDSLGNDRWLKRKARVKEKLHDLALDLIKVSAARESKGGYAFSADDENQLLFDNKFKYKLTVDQVNAINSIKREMEKNKPMDMLLCGDVGFGKTEVAFRAMFKAVNDGKQVVYLCPTTILSNQQFKNAVERFNEFPVNIALLNRFVTAKKEKEIIEKVKEGKIDILFGTHKVLNNKIVFKDLGLLIVDEEQRFGVAHKEKIKELKNNVDVLTLSATPIPRTLQMSMSGVRSLSLIETPPSQRLPIQTYVLGFNENVIKDAIYKELSRNGQVFILYNSVDDIELKVDEIKKLVPEASIQFAHGRLTKNELENRMNDFILHKFDVLVCTTIIETGIDIPNVNTLIIIDADRFGLSQLYQIRGRIGRSDKIGYAYLMYDSNKVLNDIAIKRLNTIKEFTELGSGFKIAMRDLSIRGAGDILGSEQSGFIDSIGIDLYLKLLKNEVDKLNGIEVKDDDELLKNDNNSLINVSTHISNSYISDNDLKIEIHKKINDIDSLERLNEVKAELIDRFGSISDELVIYMYEELFEKILSKYNVTNVVQNNNYIDIQIPKELSDKIDGEKLFYLSYDICRKFKLKYIMESIHIILDINGLEKHFIYYLVELFLKIDSIINK